MKLKDVFKVKNIKNFIDGNSKIFYDRIIGLPDHITEQIAYRLKQCENDCVVTGKCMTGCGCPTTARVFATDSCNHDRFPDLMDAEQWEIFKKENNDK